MNLIYVTKRDGRTEAFNADKIRNAVQKCMIQCSYDDPKLANKIAKAVTKKLDGDTTVEAIQDLVEDELIHRDLKALAKAYIKYRHDRSNVRELKSDLTQIISKLTNVKATDLDMKRENANIDTNTTMGTMLKYGSEVSKDYSLKHVIRPEIAADHMNGAIHIHDLDFRNLTINSICGLCW